MTLEDATMDMQRGLQGGTPQRISMVLERLRRNIQFLEPASSDAIDEYWERAALARRIGGRAKSDRTSMVLERLRRNTQFLEPATLDSLDKRRESTSMR